MATHTEQPDKPDFEPTQQIATFSGQIGNYVIHGAINNIKALIDSKVVPLQKENERLTKEAEQSLLLYQNQVNTILSKDAELSHLTERLAAVKGVGANLQKELSSRESELAELREALKDTTTRMKRARGILQDNGRGDWNMLDTTKVESLLKQEPIQTVCAKCGGNGYYGDGPTSFNKTICECKQQVKI